MEGVPDPKQPVLIFQFPYPKSKKVSLQNYIRTDDPITKECLAKTSAMRDDFVNALDGNSSSAVLTSGDLYLPFLYGLVVGVEGNPNIRLSAPLAFVWSSPLLEKNKSFTAYTYRYEAVMACIAYGYAHINRAYELMAHSIEASFDEDSKKAVTLLKTAAGIFEFVQKRELPRWLDIPADRPLELNTHILGALMDYCCGCAQTLTMKKGLMTGTSKSLLAKLSVDCWKRFDIVHASFKALKDYKEVNRPFRHFMKILCALGKGSAYKYMGQVSHSEEKFGTAVSYLNVASDAIKEIKIPAPNTPLFKYAKEITDSKDDIEHVKRTFFMENNHIYYQPVVPENSLVILEPKSVSALTTWIPPQPAYTQINNY